MPNEKLFLTEDEKALFRKWLDSNWADPQICPFCHNNSWAMGQQLVAPVTIGPNMSTTLGGPVVPLVFLLCQVCAYTMFFNAVMVGVVKKNG
jgi:hypothetical protein